jgi:hypothetical protein
MGPQISYFEIKLYTLVEHNIGYILIFLQNFLKLLNIISVFEKKELQKSKSGRHDYLNLLVRNRNGRNWSGTSQRHAYQIYTHNLILLSLLLYPTKVQLVHINLVLVQVN